MNFQNTAVIIYHPQAGRGKAESAAFNAGKHLSEKGWKVEGPIRTLYAGHAENVLTRKWASRVGLIVVVGGDGTLREVCAGLYKSAESVKIGFVPMGNANIIARELRIPLDPQGAIQTLTSDNIRTMDAGLLRIDEMDADGKLFLAMAEIGFGAEVVDLTERMRGSCLKAAYRFQGDLIYIAAGCAALFSRPVRRFNVTIDQEQTIKHIGAAVFANTATYAKNWSMIPEAKADDDQLNYMLRRHCGPLTTLKALSAASRRRKLPSGAAVYGQGRQFIIESEHPLAVQIDGDALMPSNRLEIQVLPGRFQFIVPQRKIQVFLPKPLT